MWATNANFTHYRYEFDETKHKVTENSEIIQTVVLSILDSA